MGFDYTHWKLTFLGLLVAGLSLTLLFLGCSMFMSSDDNGMVSLRLILTSLLGIFGGGGVFVYGVTRPRHPS